MHPTFRPTSTDPNYPYRAATDGASNEEPDKILRLANNAVPPTATENNKLENPPARSLPGAPQRQAQKRPSEPNWTEEERSTLKGDPQLMMLWLKRDGFEQEIKDEKKRTSELTKKLRIAHEQMRQIGLGHHPVIAELTQPLQAPPPKTGN
ncbi:unnamed protein product, partial [Mesorhabditis spiculigera]